MGLLSVAWYKKKSMKLHERLIADGRMKYFISVWMTFMCVSLQAQNPGGVSTGLKAWYKANGSVLNTSGDVTAWNNQVSGGVNISNVKGTPLLLASGLNFNPTIKFDGSSYMSSSVVAGSNYISTSDNSMFIVFTSAVPASVSAVMSKWENQATNRTTWEITSGGKLRFDFPSNTTGQNVSNKSVNTLSYIGSANTSGTVDSLNVNGIFDTGIATGTADPTKTGQLQMGANWVTGQYPFQGQISEVIYYGTHLALPDRRRVESYLALKYGITLGSTSSPVSYLASDITTVSWTGSSVYQNNVAGIGRDDNSGLYQKQSTSVNINSLVTMALTSIAASNVANISTFAADKSFLLWGDNNQTLSAVGVTDLPSGVASRIARVWHTQETGTVGTVRFRYSLAGTSLGTTCIDYNSLRLLVDQDGIFGSGATIISPVGFDNTEQTVDFDIDFNSTTGFYFSMGSIQTIGNPIVSNVTYCQNATATALTATGNNLKWYTVASGGTGSATAPIPATNTAGMVSYWVTQSFGTCESGRSKIDVLTKPLPAVSGNDVAICSGLTTNIALSSSLSGTTYSWTAPVQTKASGGTAGNGANIAQTLTAATSAAGTVIYNVMGTAASCSGSAKVITITVNPLPVVSGSDAVICSGSSTDIALTADVSGTTFSWFAPAQTNASGAIASSGVTGLAQTLTATTVNAGSVVYHVVGTASSCSGIAKTITVIVNPLPVVSGNDAVICSGTSTNIALSSNVSGTTYSWVLPAQTNATDGSAGNGLTISQTLTTTTANAGTVIYNVIGSANNCSGSSKTITITVNPLPVVSGSDAVICSGTNTSISLSADVAGSIFSWTLPTQTNAKDGSAGNGSTISQILTTTTPNAGTAIYNVTGSANNCSGVAKPITVTVNPLPLVSGSDAVICSGTSTSISLSADVAGTTYSWTSPIQANAKDGSAGNGSTISQILTATTSNAGTAIYNVTGSANNCSGAAKSITVTVNPLPLVSANDAVICAEGTTSIPLSADVNGTSFNWTIQNQTNTSGGSAGNGSTISQILTATTSNAGLVIYNVTGSANNCSGSVKAITVTVNPLPVVSAADVEICSSATTNIPLTADVSGTTFSWGMPTQTAANGGAASTGSPANIAQALFAPGSSVAGIVVYAVTGTANGCSGKAKNVTVTVHVLPVVTSVDSITICSGATTNIPISASVEGSTFSWLAPVQTNAAGGTASTGTPETISQKLFATTAVAGTVEYNIFVTAYTCAGFAKTITVHIKPTPIAIANDAVVCSGDTTNVPLTADVAGSTFSWQSQTETHASGGTASSGFTTNINQVLTATSTVTGTVVYNVFVSAANCVGPARKVTVSVLPLPIISSIASADTVCSGNPVILKGQGGISYIWDKGVKNQLAFNPLSTQTYTVAGKDQNGCRNTASRTIYTRALPQVTATAFPAAVCLGGNTILRGQGAVSYTWNKGVTDNIPFMPATTQTYIVTGKGVNNCTNTDSITVAVTGNVPPVITASATDDFFCKGGSTALNASGAVSYIWDQNVSNGISFIPDTTKSYTVLGTSTNGCQGVAVVKVTVYPLPSVKIAATRDSVCIGQSTTLNASGAITYSWDQHITNGAAFIPQTSQVYTATGTDAAGCKNSAVITIVVNPLPVIHANATLKTVCAGAFATLNGAGGVSYSWDNGVKNAIAFAPAMSKIYTVIGTDQFGCQNTDTVGVQVHALPVVKAIATPALVYLGTSTILKGSGAKIYSWDKNVIDQMSFSPVTTETYTVSGTDANGCSNTDTITVIVAPAQVVIPEGFSPNGDNNHDVFAIYNPAQLTINVSILNRWGNVVFQKDHYNDEFDGNSNTGALAFGEVLPDGTYFATIEIYKLDGSTEKFVRNLMIQR